MGKRAQQKAKAEIKKPRLQGKTSAAEAEAAQGEMTQRDSNENMVRAMISEVHDAMNMMLENQIFKDVSE